MAGMVQGMAQPESRFPWCCSALKTRRLPRPIFDF